MVRLKECKQCCTPHHHWEISIPYGAIKREDCVFDIKKYLAFQFLMVRLKGKKDKKDIKDIKNFNSLWCD